jgi:hypothetical protein
MTFKSHRLIRLNLFNDLPNYDFNKKKKRYKWNKAEEEEEEKKEILPCLYFFVCKKSIRIQYTCAYLLKTSRFDFYMSISMCIHL